MTTDVAYIAVSDASEKWACATLEPLVDRIIALLRQQGVVSGPLVVQEPAQFKRHESPSPAGGGKHILAAMHKEEKRPLRSTQPGTIAAYESARTLFEHVYDVWGLSQEVALKCDNVLYWCFVRNGPGAGTLKLATRWIQRLAREQVPLSLEETFEDLGTVLGDDEDDLFTEVGASWPWSKAADSRCDWGPKWYVRPMYMPPERPVPTFPEAHGPLSLMTCDKCSRFAIPLVRTRKGEFCTDCVPRRWYYDGTLNTSVLKYS